MPAAARLQWTDTPRRFGLVTRVLHWSMAGLLAWQFAALAAYAAIGRSPLTDRWIGTHTEIGFVLVILLIARAVWGLISLKRRPGYRVGALGRAARAGHLALYGLMLVVPAIALLRQLGSGWGFKPFGLVLTRDGGPKIAWMMAPADLAHALLAWVLLATIAGHIAMVLVHRFVWRDDTLSRMAGQGRG